MAEPISLTAAQQRYITRTNASRTGHWKRTARAAAKDLRRYLASIGVTKEAQVDAIVRDAHDMAVLEKAFGEG